MDKVLSIRPNGQIIALFKKIKDYQESANRTEIVNAGIETVLVTTVDWKETSKFKVREDAGSNLESAIPEFMQIRVDEDKYVAIREQIIKTFQLKKAPPAPYVIRLILNNYLSHLETFKSGNETSADYGESTVFINGDICEEQASNFREQLKSFNDLGSVELKLNVIYEKLLKMEERCKR